MREENPAQRTLGWFRSRLGKFTGSEVGKLMQRGKDAEFGSTAASYIMKVMKARLNDERMVSDDSMFEEYVERHGTTCRAMQWGTDNEPYARMMYERLTGRKVVEVSSVICAGLPTFASSPDGYVYDEETGESGVIEIKCPIDDAQMMKYLCVTCAEDLKSANSDYYYQCHSHMMVTGASWCDLCIYCPELRDGLKMHIVRIWRDMGVEAIIRERVEAAEAYIGMMVEKIESYGHEDA